MENRVIVRFGKIGLCVALFAALVYSSAFGQALSSSAIPANTLKAFQAVSAGAAATWTQGPNRSYEATFVKTGVKMVYVYDQEGMLQQKKAASTVASFPPSVNAAIAAAYPKGNVETAYKVVNRTNVKFYEVQVAIPSGVERMRFDLEGKPLGKTSLASAQPVAPQPVASAPMAMNTQVSKPVAQPVVVKPATQVSPAVTKPAPMATSPVVSNQATTPKVSPLIAMRGESASTTKTTTVVKDDLMDDDLGDLLEDDGDLDDLFKDDDSWDDINLDDELEDDSDLLDGTDDLDDDLGFDSDIEEVEDDL